MLPGDDDQIAARAIPLDIMLESGGKTQRWNRLRVQLTEEKFRPAMSPTVPSLTSSPRPKSTRKVRWSSSRADKASSSSTTCITQTTTQTQCSSHLSVPIHLSSVTIPSPITDLCHTLQKGKALATADCFGNISCNSRIFNLYHHDYEPDHLSAVSLSTIMGDQNEGGGIVRIDYIKRLKLALALSYSVLHLYKTPWLAKTLGPEDIVFLREHQQASSKAACCFDRPFLAKMLASTTPDGAGVQQKQEDNRPMDFTILSLGLLLIQIIVGRQISDLALTPDLSFQSVLSKKELASKYTASVMENGGMNYADAVQWCLGSMFSVACLDDDKFSQDFYTAVIIKLEGDLGTQSLMTVSESET